MKLKYLLNFNESIYILFVCKIIKLVYNLVVPCSLSGLMVEFSHTVSHKVSIEFSLVYLSPYHIVKPRENPNFLKKKWGKMVISVKIQNFSRSRMMKRTSPLESSREI